MDFLRKATRNISLINVISTRTHYYKPFSYDNHYYGKFDYHDQNKYPRRMSVYKELEILDEIHKIKNMEVDKPSPFHVVRRIGSINQPWHIKVTLRRLNLHSSCKGDVAVIPNTPQFNALLHKVKHLIELKPATFSNGKIPTEEDIGALRICPYTGNVTIDEKIRMQKHRLHPGKSLLFQGNMLRGKINNLYGLSSSHCCK